METTLNWKRLLPLTIIVAVYLCIGAVIFQHLEGGPEIDRRHNLKEMIKKFIGNHSCINRHDLQQFLGSIGSESEFAQGTLLNKSVSTRWDFTGSFSFVITVVTTIGYGNYSPITEIGKLSVIAYAFVGIPLTFLMLQGLGQHLTLLSNKVNKLKLCSQKPGVNKNVNMVIIILLGVSFLFVGPTFLFMYVEGWSLMEGLYYCFVTLSTIGFGDYIPALTENRFTGHTTSPIYRITTYVWILFGLAYVALIISYISGVLIKKAEKMERMSKAKIEAEIKDLQKELSKTKSNIFTMAGTVADSVAQAAGYDSNRKENDTTDTSTKKPLRTSITNSPRHKRFKRRKKDPVVLLGYKRTLEDDTVFVNQNETDIL